jgi:hypothetical protein
MASKNIFNILSIEPNLSLLQLVKFYDIMKIYVRRFRTSQNLEINYYIDYLLLVWFFLSFYRTGISDYALFNLQGCCQKQKTKQPFKHPNCYNKAHYNVNM